MLKNMFYTLIGATFFLTIIWVAVGYDKYGSDLIYHHLNLKAMVLKVRDEWYGYNIYDDIKNLRNITNFFGSWSPLGVAERLAFGVIGINPIASNNVLTFLVNAFNILVSPINLILFGFALLGYISYAIIMIGITIIAVLTQCLEFVFNPMFI